MSARLIVKPRARALGTVQAATGVCKCTASVLLFHLKQFLFEAHTLRTEKVFYLRKRNLLTGWNNFRGDQKDIGILSKFRHRVMREGRTSPHLTVIAALLAIFNKALRIRVFTDIFFS
jgi:hypothetical protein